MPAETDRHATAVARYFEAWNAVDQETLTKAVAAAWTADGTYTDPLTEVSGHRQIAAVIAAAHEQFPGFVFYPTAAVDGHHDMVRFSWELVNEADGTAPVAGFDVITLDEQGRIRSVLGFLHRVPVAER